MFITKPQNVQTMLKNIKTIAMLILAGTAITITSCKKEGCTDANANNYSEDAKKDDNSCTYPTINLTSAGDGDVTGSGGSATATNTWNNTNTRSELNMDITSAKGGKMQVVLKDADGVEVLNETLEVGVGDDSITKCSATGTAGDWTVTVTLTDFDGDGSYSLDKGC